MDGRTALILAIGALALLTLLVVIVSLRRGPRAYYVRRDALTPGVSPGYLESLEDALGDRYRVLPRTRVSEFVDVKPRLSHRTRNWARDRIRDLRFDFTLLARADGSAVGILLGGDVDLPRRERQKRAFLRKVCDTVALPVLTLQPAMVSDPVYLRRAVEGAGPDSPEPAESAARREPSLA